MFGLSGRHAHALGKLLLPEVTESGIHVMSSNLVLQNETDPVLWRGPVIAGAIRQFWSETSWGPLDYLLVDMLRAQATCTHRVSVPAGRRHRDRHESAGPRVDDRRQAVNMAQKMDVPVLGVVENMSYIECPDCGKKIEVFGKSKLDEVAAQYDLDILGRLPIDPALAAACDAGKIEENLPTEFLPQAVTACEAVEARA